MTKLNEQQLEGLKPLPAGKTAEELGYKVGDKFVVLDSVNSGVIRGKVLEMIAEDYTSSPCFKDDDIVEYNVGLNLLAPYNPTPSWETLKYEDVIVHRDGGEAKVLGVMNNSFLRSIWDKPDMAHGWITKEQARGYGWTVKAESVCDKCNK